MDEGTFVSGFIVQSSFLAIKSEGEATGDGQYGDESSEVHISQCPQEPPADQSHNQEADTPADELAFETTVDKGLLEPLVDGIPVHDQTPKKALMTTETSTRKRHEPPHPMSSLLMSLSPEFHLMYTLTPPTIPTTAPMARVNVETGST